MSRDGRTEICSCNFCTSTIHGGRMSQGAREGGAAMRGMDGQKFAPWQLLLRCSNKLHPCNDAISALPPSMVGVCCKEPGKAAMDTQH